MSEESEIAPRLAAAMKSVRQVQSGCGPATGRVATGRLAGGLRRTTAEEHAPADEEEADGEVSS